MEQGLNISWYDFVILGIFVLFIIRGIWVGMFKQITGLLSLCLAYFVASRYHDRLFPFLKDISDNPMVVFAASCAILFLATYIVGLLVGRGLAYVMEITVTKGFDRTLGGILGIAKAFVLVVLLHMVLGSVLPPESKLTKECETCDLLDQATDFARAIIQDEEVRQALMQRTPATSAEDLQDLIKKKEEELQEVKEKEQTGEPVQYNQRQVQPQG